MTYTGVDPEKCLDQALDMLDYEEFRRSQADARAEGRRIGVGISLFVEPTALGAGSLIGTEAAHVKVSPGGHITVALGTSGHGQSIATTMAQIVADELGVGIDDVVVIEGDTAMTPFGGGTGGSRSGVIGGAAAHGAAAQVREKLLSVAAHLLEAAPEDLEIQRGAGLGTRLADPGPHLRRGRPRRLRGHGQAAPRQRGRTRGHRAVLDAGNHLRQRLSSSVPSRSTRQGKWACCATS